MAEVGATYHGRTCAHGHGTERYKSSRRCVTCIALKSSRYHTSRRGRVLNRARKLLTKYGITDAQVTFLMRKQHGTCAICSVSLVWGSKASYGACVDHCHLTGTVRGLLCYHCNRGLGLFMDNPAFLEAAASYLKAA